MARKYVYDFREGRAAMKNLLGGKGANIAEMTRMGIPVPPGFTITTEVCTYYMNKQKYPKGMNKDVERAVKNVEKIMGSEFGNAEKPLLFSVRSGARVSMPGMMDTVLNLGLNDTTIEGLAKLTNNERFAWDCYRRFVQMYGDVVLGLKPESKTEMDPFEVVLDKVKKAHGAKEDTELDTGALKELVRKFKTLIKDRLGVDFPEEPMDQLWGAIGAVFKSWNTPRAIAYREINGIPNDWGTAVNVQVMVFGNMGEDSATGVAFTRDPATGKRQFYGEYLVNAQGEDVVAGIRTPQPINESTRTSEKQVTLEGLMPDLYKQLDSIQKRLDKHYKDMQDIEFTIQTGKLWMLQTRVGKRTGMAAIRMAVDMVGEGLISKREALMRVEPDQLNQLLRPIFDAKEKKVAIDGGKGLAKGLNAGPGAASGKVAFSATDAEAMAAKGDDVILVRLETSPDDIRGMAASQGILTARGGMTSHAALVGRQMGKVCVVGCGALEIDYSKGQMKVKGKAIKEGDWISLDGTTGEVLDGQLKTHPSEVVQVLIEGTLKPEDSADYRTFAKLMEWADKYRRLGVRTNADLPDQARNAIALGAEGIGLTRTEHMFFEGNRIDWMRQMILSDTPEGREEALSNLLPMQRKDFIGIFEVMDGKPVTIRTLDPPLHEFLPHADSEIRNLAKKMKVTYEKLKATIEALHESNPMLGHRGCRLGITHPEITAMQARAILEAACDVAKRGIPVHPEIMIPLVGHVNELRDQEKIVREVAASVFKEQGTKVPYLVGTMIELPRSALTADEIAGVAEFFSFGTNDLTQTCFGLSRDDGVKFMPYYEEHGIIDRNPFQAIDQSGVGQLMEIGVKKGRKTRKKLKVGICGEHGGEPSSVEFCHTIGLDYVSCSPFRVPIARLAAARAVVKEGRGLGKPASDIKRIGKTIGRRAGKTSRGIKKKGKKVSRKVGKGARKAARAVRKGTRKIGKKKSKKKKSKKKKK